MKIHLVDGTYELFRGFYGPPPRKAPDGREIGATLSLLRSLLALISDVLDFSRIEAGCMDIERVTTELVSIVHDVVATVSAHAEEKGLELTVGIEGGVPQYAELDRLSASLYEAATEMAQGVMELRRIKQQVDFALEVSAAQNIQQEGSALNGTIDEWIAKILQKELKTGQNNYMFEARQLVRFKDLLGRMAGANIPVTSRAERVLHDNGILSVPDFVANAGGVICASVEYRGGTRKQAFETIEEKIRENTQEVLSLSKAHSQIPAEAAVSLAKQRVAEAMAYRRAH